MINLNTSTPTPTIHTASVKVMRSHDYCHFEVQLGTTDATTPESVDELRKTAARLADKAVEQYKICKEVAEDRRSNQYTVDSMRLRELTKEIKAKSETDRSVEEKATLKDYEDAVFRANRSYDYEDDFGDFDIADADDDA